VVDDAHVPYNERDGFSNPNLGGSSPASVVETVRIDPAVRQAHGTAVMAAALVRVVAQQRQVIEELRERVEELEASEAKRLKPASAKTRAKKQP
jgi:hypothetical protein